MYDENGEAHVTDVVDFGLTLDERIADGFYFAKSVKVLKYILEHPEVLDRPLSEPLGIEF
jgi:pyruvate/2-oxoglutarate dehydrogenase complex dihydrolipoamide acyltransferase (E2) component